VIYIELRLRGKCRYCFRILGEYYLRVREMLNGMFSLVITTVFLNIFKGSLTYRNHIWNNFSKSVKLFPAVSRGRWYAYTLISWGRLVSLYGCCVVCWTDGVLIVTGNVVWEGGREV